MAQFIQKPGGDKTTLEDAGFTDLQSAANVGFAPVSAPAIDGTIKLGDNDVPVTVEDKGSIGDDVAPVVPEDNIAGAGDRFGIDLAPEEQDATFGTEERDDIRNTVTEQANEFGNGTLATEAYINGVFRAYHGRNANPGEINEFTGKGLQDVLDAISTGANGPAATPTGPTGGVTDDGTPSVGTGATGVDDYLRDLENTINSQTGDARETLTENQTKVRELNAQIDAYEALFAANNLGDTTEVVDIKKATREELNAIKEKAGLIGTGSLKMNKIIGKANESLDKIKDANSLRDAQDAYDYTMLTIQQRMYSGMASDAQAMITSISNQLYKNETLRINYMQLNEQIDARTADDLRQQAQYNNQQWQLGYAPIPTDRVDDMIQIYGSARIHTNPTTGQSYLKPEVETTGTELDFGVIGKDEDGNSIYGFIDKVNGQTYSTSQLGGDLGDMYTIGATGGQCGDYIHKIADNVPPLGDMFEDKMNSGNMSTDEYQVGDVLIQETNMPYGHVSIVTAVKDGVATVMESNYGLDEKVGTRNINFGDSSVKGVYRGGTMKTPEVEEREISPYQQERSARTIQSVNELYVSAVASPGIFGRTAALWMPDAFRGDEYRNFKAELDTLKANITFGELTAMREASKTGGALGQVSDREGQLLGAALGGLNMSQSPENFAEQLLKINASITRWNNALNEGVHITAPDGQVIEIID